ncbi:lectin C-type domain protein [Oesophagostomum dentatum]|uniref:Lectin C-type domain protein n=1 Tax=Oesophagostomum dentatum TaxID=61180 RepID=A0A0B1T8K6_OESDE|nr:lectin C-type domain protein [Oesophagostomum dentatum]
MMPTTQTLAERNCRQHDSLLVPIPTYCGADHHKLKFLSSLMSWHSSFWIGLKRVNGIFRWNDGTDMSFGDKERWIHGDPTSYGNCVISYYYYSYEGPERRVFSNINCDNNYPYICAAKPCDTEHYCGLNPSAESDSTSTETPMWEETTYYWRAAVSDYIEDEDNLPVDQNVTIAS